MNILHFMRFRKFTQNPATLLTIRNLHDAPIEVSWMKPEFGWTKLNFDGLCKGNSRKSSIGGVLRDHNAKFLFGYAEYIGKSRSVADELATLRRGLELVLESRLDRVWLDGDSKAIVEIVGKQRILKCVEAQKHVSDINSMIPELKICVLTHIFREGNRVADKFANLGYRSDKFEIWREVPPSEVLPVMHDDAEGKVHLRKR